MLTSPPPASNAKISGLRMVLISPFFSHTKQSKKRLGLVSHDFVSKNFAPAKMLVFKLDNDHSIAESY